MRRGRVNEYEYTCENLRLNLLEIRPTEHTGSSKRSRWSNAHLRGQLKRSKMVSKNFPALVYREGEAIEMYEGHDAVISCTDDEPLDTLSIRKGYLSEDRREWFLDET